MHDPKLHRTRRQELLETALIDLTRGEAVACHERRALRRGDGEVRGAEGLAVDDAEIPLHRRRGPLPGAETVLAADMERKPWLEVPLVLSEKTSEAAEMVVMAVAQHERIDLGRLHPEQLHVVVEGL